MKISYEFVTGEVSEVEVDERLGGMLLDLDRQQYNNDQKETRRHFSLNGLDYEGDLFAEGFSIVAEGLRGLAKAEGENTKDKSVKAQKVEKQESVAEVQQESPATLEGIRALMAQKTQEGKSKEIKELLQKYGAAKLSAVKPEDYPVLMQEAQVL